MNDDRSSIAHVGEISDSEGARARWYDRLLTRVGLKSRDSIRDDLEEALAEIGEENFSPQERAMLKNVLGFHRIRVDVTSSSHPRWIRHTNTFGDPVDATEVRIARQQIFHDPERPSRLHLTVC